MRRKNWLAVVLSIVMAVTFIPSVAFATDEGEATVEAQQEAEAVLEAEPEVVAAEEVDTPDDVETEDGEDLADEGAFALDKVEITDEDFALEEPDYGYAIIEKVGDIGIEDFEWDNELCFTFSMRWSDTDGADDVIYMKPYKAGTATLTVTGENGETVDVSVSVSNELVEKIKYERILTDKDLFRVVYYDDPEEYGDLQFHAYLDTEWYMDKYIDYEDADEYFGLSRDDFVGKFVARYNGSDYEVNISTSIDEDMDAYDLTAPGLPNLAVGDSFELIFASGEYEYSIPVKKQLYCYVYETYKNTFTWTGNDIKPTFKMEGEIYDEEEEDYISFPLVEGKDYTLEYEYDNGDDAASVGWGRIKVYPCGDYYFDTWCDFKIIPKGTTLKTPKKAKKAITVKWNAQKTPMSYDRITGYQIQVATNSKFTKNKKTVNVKGYKNTSKKVTKLKKKKKYWVRIRTYYVDEWGDYLYSSWSKAKTCKTK